MSGYDVIMAMSKREITEVIDTVGKSQEEKKMLCDRIIKKMSYEEIVDRYYNGAALCDRKKKMIVDKFIRPAVISVLEKAEE